MATAVTFGAATGDTERVTGLWAGTEISDDNGAHVIEVIDYDFGSASRHGIVRDVPGLSPEAAVTASSATAPDQVELIGMGEQTRIRIGDPTRTVSGRHRYRIQYPLTGLAPDGKVAWDAVGTGWSVDLSRIEIHLVAPFEFTATSCVQGRAGSRQPCRVSQPEPGHLVVRIDELGAGKGATLYASAGRRLASTPHLPVPQSGAVADARISPLLPGLLAALVALVALVVAAMVSVSVRRAGRERVATGRPGEAAWGATGAETRVDAGRLAASVTPGSIPPDELTPAQGGILLTEGVANQHKVAWLISAAADGYLDIKTDGPDPTLVRRSLPAAAPVDPQTVALLDQMFDHRNRVTLGRYNPNVAAMWKSLGDRLESWRRASGLWDPAGERRCRRARLRGVVVAPLGLIVHSLAASWPTGRTRDGRGTWRSVRSAPARAWPCWSALGNCGSGLRLDPPCGCGSSRCDGSSPMPTRARSTRRLRSGGLGTTWPGPWRWERSTAGLTPSPRRPRFRLVACRRSCTTR